MVVNQFKLSSLLAFFTFFLVILASPSTLEECEKTCKSSNLKKEDEKYCMKQCIVKIRQANQPRVSVDEIAIGVFNITWNGPTKTSANRWKFNNITYHIFIRQVSGYQFNPQEATPWFKTATNTTKWMTAEGARPGIWYQFKVVATAYEAGKNSQIWEAISPATMTRAVGRIPEKPTKISARQYRKANTTLSNAEITFHRPKASDYQIITYRLRLRCMPRILDVNKVLLIREHRKKVKAKLSLEPYVVLFKHLPVKSVCQAKIQAVAAWGSKRFKSKVAKYCFYLWPQEGSHKVNDKVRLHNLCHTKVKSNPPIITSKTIYPMKYGNYSLSLIWIAPESSERIHIYSYHIQWTVISKNANSNSKNYYNNSVFIESHDIALRRHIYDEDDYFYTIGNLPQDSDVLVKIFPVAYSGLGQAANLTVSVSAATKEPLNLHTRSLPDLTHHITTHTEIKSAASSSNPSQSVPLIASIAVFLSICIVSILFGEVLTWKYNFIHVIKNYCRILSKSRSTSV